MARTCVTAGIANSMAAAGQPLHCADKCSRWTYQERRATLTCPFQTTAAVEIPQDSQTKNKAELRAAKPLGVMLMPKPKQHPWWHTGTQPFPVALLRENPVSPLAPCGCISRLSPRPWLRRGRQTAVLVCLRTCQPHSLKRHACLPNDRNACSTPSQSCLGTLQSSLPEGSELAVHFEAVITLHKASTTREGTRGLRGNWDLLRYPILSCAKDWGETFQVHDLVFASSTRKRRKKIL